MTATPQQDLVAIVQGAGTLKQLQMALPKHLDPTRFTRTVITELNANPMLRRCEPASFLSCMIRSAQLGLEVGKDLGHAYFIPFENNKRGITECTLIIGYKGYRALAMRNPNIVKIEAHCVYQGDHFRVLKGFDDRMEHEPKGEPVAAAVTHAYAIALFKDGTRQFDVLSRKQIDAIRDRGRRNSVWNTDYEEMARKTALRRLTKNLDLAPEVARALHEDDEDELALAASRTPAKITQLQQEATDFSAETRRRLHEEMTEAMRLVREGGGDPLAILGVKAIDPDDEVALEVHVANLHTWLEAKKNDAQ